MADDFSDVVKRALAGAGELVKDNRARTVWKVGAFYVKKFKHASFFERMRNFFAGAPAKKEFELLTLLQGRAPEALGHCNAGAFSLVVTREVPNSRNLKSVLAARALSFEEKKKLIGALAELTVALIEKGVTHRDYHAGNMLLAGERLYVLDLHRARRAMRARELFDMLAQLAHSLHTFFTRQDLVRLLKMSGVSDDDASTVFEMANELRHEYAQSRSKRCLVTSSEFEVRNASVGRIFARRDAGIEPEKIVERLSSMSPRKALPNRELYVIDDKIFAKVFKNPSAGKDSWYNAHALAVRHVPTPRCFALVERGGESVLVGEWFSDAQPLYDFIKSKFSRGVPRSFVDALANFVRKMHEVGVFHKDLKANNVLVREAPNGDVSFTVIDVDRVAFCARISDDDRIFNLAQLSAAVGPPVTMTDRLRFFQTYVGNDPLWLDRGREIIAAVMDATRSRRHVWPVTP